MKSFFEEYGFIILSAIVVIALIGIANGLKAEVQTNISDIMTAFKGQLIENSKLIIK